MDEEISQPPTVVLAAERGLRDAAQRRALDRHLPEMRQLERLLADAPDGVKLAVQAHVAVRGQDLPIYRVELGSGDPQAPAMLVVGGVHGLERIGTQVVLAFLRSLFERLRWDEALQARLAQVHLIVMPLLNPGGMYLNQRANPRGVDLMRNAPIRAHDEIPLLLGGQRWSRHLPWYTGDAEQGMEAENQALEAVIEQRLAGRPFSLALDCHSGFGFQDRIWFPYAYRRRPMKRIASVMALKLLWERTYPHHNYVFEPQSSQYLTHGDLWDHFYKRLNKHQRTLFLPLTLEMGSWQWVRKRPSQLFNVQGLFNPLVPHRHQRVLRRHLVLFDFLLGAVSNHARWLPSADDEPMLRQSAIMHWYRHHD